MDFVKKARPDISNERLVGVGRIATIAVMVIGALWAPQIARFEGLYAYLQAVLAYISPPIVALFVLGVFWPRANASGSVAALATGLVVAVGMLIAQPDIHFLYIAPILFVICSMAHVVVSLLTPPPDPEQVAPLIWTRALFQQDTEALRHVAWYKNYRYQSAALLLITAWVVFSYW